MKTGVEWAKERLEIVQSVNMKGVLLPNSCHLFWEPNAAGGRTYYTDEVGGGVLVWDTCLVDQSTLLAAMTKENEIRYLEQFIKRAELETT